MLKIEVAHGFNFDFAIFVQIYAMPHEQLKLENQLCFPFYAISRLIIRQYQEDLDALGITYTQYLVMLVLWEQNQMSVNNIAEQLHLNTNTVTPLLKRMERMGLIARTPSEDDHRKVLITLTTKGKAMENKAAGIPLRLIEKMNIDPSAGRPEDLLQFKKQLSDIITLLKSI